MARKQKVVTLDYTPQPRQDVLHRSKARLILYGGAAGGGKSHALRWDGLTFCLQNPGCMAYLYRRTTKQLMNNHVLPMRSLPKEIGTYRSSNNWFEFYNGSFLFFRHCEHENDVEDAQGQEFHWLGVDEAGQFTPYMLSYLLSRVRTGGWRPVQDTLLPRVVFTANPGGEAHHFLKEKFIDGREPEAMFEDEATGMNAVFIPAKMADNKYLDKSYAAQFGELPEELQKMLRDGDWSVVVGAFFECFDKRPYPAGNVVDMEIPEHWMRFRACDWGFNSPFAIGWYAVSDGEETNGITLEEGTLVKYREWYGFDGTTKKGNGIRMDAAAVAEGIKEREAGERVKFGVADPAMWRTDSGRSAAEEFADNGVFWNKADRQREPGWQQMYARIRDQRLLFHYRCEHSIRTIAAVMRDDKHLEDVKKGGEDHCFVAGTLVDTQLGPVEIEHLDADRHRVWSGGGWRRFRNVRLTRRGAETVIVRFSNGVVIRCTPDHRLMDHTDEWRYAKDFTGVRPCTIRSLSVRPSRNSTASGITCAASISSARGYGFTARYIGGFAARLRRGGMFTTLMATVRTMRRSILSALMLPRTMATDTGMRLPRWAGAASGWRGRRLRGGTAVRRAGNGIGSNTSSIAGQRCRSLLSRFASIAVIRTVSGKLPRIYRSGAAIIARPVRCVSVERAPNADVYCLTEPEFGRFTVHGIVVSNCADETRYACMARPWTEHRAPPPLPMIAPVTFETIMSKQAPARGRARI